MKKLLAIWRGLWAQEGFWGYPPILWIIWIICIPLLFFVASEAHDLNISGR